MAGRHHINGRKLAGFLIGALLLGVIGFFAAPFVLSALGLVATTPVYSIIGSAVALPTHATALGISLFTAATALVGGLIGGKVATHTDKRQPHFQDMQYQKPVTPRSMQPAMGYGMERDGPASNFAAREMQRRVARANASELPPF